MTIVKRAGSSPPIDCGDRRDWDACGLLSFRIECFLMVENVVATFSAVWFFLAPVLCAAGVMTHPCECTEGLKECGSCCDAGDENGCGCVDEGCSHDGCDNDPCGVTLAPGNVDGCDQFRAPPFEIASFETTHFLQPDPSPDGGSITGSSGPPGLGKNLPYPPSDLPLRV